ncbi:MAG: hypothetical protein E7020_00935 [Alphaproteobacteria bacterium]|nr:hypothetical protein [Alphaproteobacteria bacterium]
MPSFSCGSILNWKNFYIDKQTHEPKNKLFIVLGTKDPSKFLLAITTSQKHSKISSPGCYFEDSYYMIDAQSHAGFPKDTWILLGELKVISAANLLKESIENNNIEVVGAIKEQIFNGLINCAKKSIDVSDQYKELMGKN